MKDFTLLVCVSIACCLVNASPIGRDFHKECQADKATHLSEDIIKALDKGDIIDKAKVSAHLLCISTKAGIQNEDGSINKSVIREKFAKYYSDQSLEIITNKCSEEGRTAAETALKLALCVNEYS